MAIGIGTLYTGTLYSFNNQCIKTKFLMLGLPVIPLGSVYQITESQGISIPLHKKSVFYGYCRFPLAIIGIVMLIGGLQDDWYPAIISVVGGVLTALGVYTWLTGRGVSKEERKVRTILQEAFDYNMLPDRLPLTVRMLLLKELLRKCAVQFNEESLQSLFAREHTASADIQLLYAVAYYMNTTEPNEAYQRFLQQYPA